MAQTTPLAAATAAGNSADITVASTTANPSRVAAFTTDAGGLTKDFQAFVQYKTPAGNYEQLFDDYRKPITLSLERPNVTLWAVGVYRVSKGQTAHALGICLDQ